jgi:hypothetical protein
MSRACGRAVIDLGTGVGRDFPRQAMVLPARPRRAWGSADLAARPSSQVPPEPASAPLAATQARLKRRPATGELASSSLTAPFPLPALPGADSPFCASAAAASSAAIRSGVIAV